MLVGGDTAFVKDFFDISDTYTPLIILVVLGLSFLLLTVVFRSIVVPVKAIIMNLLSVGAAYGLIVLVFQKGGPAFGESIANFLGFQQVDAIEAWLPLFLFSILFGLSMDYHVFLLTRIREQYDKTHDNAAAVAYGLRTTGGIITGAAIIMVAVFAGFAAGRLTSLEQMGFGLAVAVFLDATVVRSILVPSTMRLLGDRNWYLPQLAAVAAEDRRRRPRGGGGPVVDPGHAGRAGRGRRRAPRSRSTERITTERPRKEGAPRSLLLRPALRYRGSSASFTWRVRRAAIGRSPSRSGAHAARRVRSTGAPGCLTRPAVRPPRSPRAEAFSFRLPISRSAQLTAFFT